MTVSHGKVLLVVLSLYLGDRYILAVSSRNPHKYWHTDKGERLHEYQTDLRKTDQKAR